METTYIENLQLIKLKYYEQLYIKYLIDNKLDNDMNHITLGGLVDFVEDFILPDLENNQ